MVRNFFVFLGVLLVNFAVSGLEHPMHQFLLIGQNEVFASHIVYKKPHHYQVVLKVTLPTQAKSAYDEARASFPNNTFILKFDHFDLSTIQNNPSLSGTLFRDDQDGNRVEVISGVVLNSDQYRVLYFNELPLSLEN